MALKLKLVYRVLRSISDGALYFFYSDVCVEGDVPEDGPLIICSCHHNELIDIATLAATIPYRRMINYWTKASLFKNPISRFILESAGTVPVAREPKASTSDAAAARTRLFLGSFHALAGGEALGVFPEGTSYTEPRIVQVKDGVSRVALEYPHWARASANGTKGKVNAEGQETVTLVPCAIVYTDKSAYKSRVYVKYGSPIDLAPFLSEFEAATDEDAKFAVTRSLTRHVGSIMMQMTINAPDWDTLYAAQMARDILWPDERKIPLCDFVDVSQTLVDLLSDPTPSPTLVALKAILIRYSSLLYHSRLTHASLPSLLPALTLTPATVTRRRLTRTSALTSFLALLTTLLVRSNPLKTAQLPILLHVPVYTLAALAARLAEYEEARAQLKVISGVLSMSAVNLGVGWAVWRVLRERMVEGFRSGTMRAAGVLGARTGGDIGSVLGRLTEWTSIVGRKALGVAVVFGTAWTLVWWHNRVVASGRRIYHGLRARFHTLLYTLRPSSALSASAIKPYTRPPPPVFNPYIKRPTPSATPTPERTPSPSPSPSPPPPKVPTRTLIPHLLSARAEAESALSSYLQQLTSTSLSSGARRVTASGHLALRYNLSSTASAITEGQEQEPTLPAVDPYVPPSATRNALEVVEFLRARGATF